MKILDKNAMEVLLHQIIKIDRIYLFDGIMTLIILKYTLLFVLILIIYLDIIWVHHF